MIGPGSAVAQDNVSRPVNQSRMPDQTSSQPPSDDEDNEENGDASQSPADEESETETVSRETTDAPTEQTSDQRDDAEQPPEPSAGQNGRRAIEADNPVDYCNQFMVPYLESSSRKLYRALAGRQYDLQQLSLQDWVELDVRLPNGEMQTVEFEVVRQKDGKVAGLVDSARNYRRTLVVAMPQAGPIITSYRWPESDDIGRRADCKPHSSRIEYPIVPVDEIDPEPFKFWGLRVIWRLPKSFDRGDQDRDNLYQTLSEVMSSERTANASD